VVDETMSLDQIEWRNTLFHAVGPSDGFDDAWSLLSDMGYTIHHFDTIEQYQDHIHTAWTFFPVALLLDSTQWAASDYEILHNVQTIRPELKIVMINSEPEKTPELQPPACMYLKAPFDLHRLLDMVAELVRCNISHHSRSSICTTMDDRKAFRLKEWTCPHPCNSCPHPCNSCSVSHPAY
jgi:DNA-binding NtrC family response regulator